MFTNWNFGFFQANGNIPVLVEILQDKSLMNLKGVGGL